jgi:hypothetical protein
MIPHSRFFNRSFYTKEIVFLPILTIEMRLPDTELESHMANAGVLKSIDNDDKPEVVKYIKANIEKFASVNTKEA